MIVVQASSGAIYKDRDTLVTEIASLQCALQASFDRMVGDPQDVELSQTIDHFQERVRTLHTLLQELTLVEAINGDRQGITKMAGDGVPVTENAMACERLAILDIVDTKCDWGSSTPTPIQSAMRALSREIQKRQDIFEEEYC